MQNYVLGIAFDNLCGKLLLLNKDGIRGEKCGNESFKEALERVSQDQLNLDLDWHYAGMTKGNRSDGYYNEAIFFAFDDEILKVKNENATLSFAPRFVEEEVMDKKLWYLIPFGMMFKEDKSSFMHLEFFSI